DGTLSGPDLDVGGQTFAVGDQIIARAPAHHLHPTHQRHDYVRNGTTGTITAIHPGDHSTVDIDSRVVARVDGRDGAGGAVADVVVALMGGVEVVGGSAGDDLVADREGLAADVEVGAAEGAV